MEAKAAWASDPELRQLILKWKGRQSALEVKMNSWSLPRQRCRRQRLHQGERNPRGAPSLRGSATSPRGYSATGVAAARQREAIVGPMFATGPDAAFVPIMIMFRGWCTKETSGRNSLPSKEVVDLMTELMDKLSLAHRGKIVRCVAPYHKTWQGVFVMKSGQSTDNVKVCVRALNDFIKAQQHRVERPGALLRG